MNFSNLTYVTLKDSTYLGPNTGWFTINGFSTKCPLGLDFEFCKELVLFLETNYSIFFDNNETGERFMVKNWVSVKYLGGNCHVFCLSCANLKHQNKEIISKWQAILTGELDLDWVL